MAKSAWKNPVKQYTAAPMGLSGSFRPSKSVRKIGFHSAARLNFTQVVSLLEFCKLCNKRASLIASFVPSYIDCETIIVSTFPS
jgi:hypothetical protein